MWGDWEKVPGAEEEGRDVEGCRDGGKVGMNGILGRTGRNPKGVQRGIRE